MQRKCWHSFSVTVHLSHGIGAIVTLMNTRGKEVLPTSQITHRSSFMWTNIDWMPETSEKLFSFRGSSTQRASTQLLLSSSHLFCARLPAGKCLASSLTNCFADFNGMRDLLQSVYTPTERKRDVKAILAMLCFWHSALCCPNNF